jgi:hypothetical protein
MGTFIIIKIMFVNLNEEVLFTASIEDLRNKRMFNYSALQLIKDKAFY